VILSPTSFERKSIRRINDEPRTRCSAVDPPQEVVRKTTGRTVRAPHHSRRAAFRRIRTALVRLARNNSFIVGSIFVRGEPHEFEAGVRHALVTRKAFRRLGLFFK
jgi:hypothetical protein